MWRMSFLMLDARTYKADYISPNVNKLLGITIEQLQEDVHVLAKLQPKETGNRTKNCLAGFRRMNRKNGILSIFIRKPESGVGSILLLWAAK